MEEAQNEIIDLNFDVTEADVARPILKDGTYDFTIRSTRQETSKKGHPMLIVGFALAQMVETVDNKEVNPGFTITSYYLMQPVGKMTQEMVNDRFKRIHFAAAGAGRVNTGEWIGKSVRCQVKIREAEGDYSASNEIAGVYPPAAKRK